MPSMSQNTNLSDEAVILTTDVFVSWGSTRQVPLQRLSLQALIEDRFDAAIGQGAEMQGPLTGGFEPGLTVDLGQTNDTQAGAESLFGVGARGHDVLHDQRALRADLARPIDDPAGGPFQITLVRLGTVLIHGGEFTALETALMGRDPFGFVKELYGRVGQSHLEALVD